MVDWNKIKKTEHIIMVVPRKKLFGESERSFFQGFSKQDFMPKLIGNLGFLSRGKVNSLEEHSNDGLFAESDENYKQILPYVIIVNKNLKKVYAYKRASKQENAHEARLHGNWSWGVGGHVDFQDDFFSMSLNEFLKDNIYREIDEEVDIKDGEITSLKHIGFINDETNSVGRVHLGVLYIAETDAKNISPKDNESVEGKFLSLKELEEISFNPDVVCENWSRIALDPLREILSD